MFCCLDQCHTCDRNGGPAKESIDHKYADFIEKELLPELNFLTTKYAFWWTFKPFSLLKSYLHDREIVLDEYFCLDELKDQVVNVLRKTTQYSYNKDVIILIDEEQQMLFDSWCIYEPDIIKDHLMAHIMAAPNEISNSLQNKHIIENFYIDSPMDLLYKDPSSVFWLPPSIDFAINNSTGNVYSWNRVLFLFTEFCHNTDYFTRISDTIIEVNENTFLDSLFGFKYFHLSQIETIIKQLTKFLGRKNGIIQSCHFVKNNPLFNVKSTNKHPNVFTFIDDIINNNNNMKPSSPSGIYI